MIGQPRKSVQTNVAFTGSQTKLRIVLDTIYTQHVRVNSKGKRGITNGTQREHINIKECTCK